MQNSFLASRIQLKDGSTASFTLSSTPMFRGAIKVARRIPDYTGSRNPSIRRPSLKAVQNGFLASRI
jgi:hypothetical protein